MQCCRARHCDPFVCRLKCLAWLAMSVLAVAAEGCGRHKAARTDTSTTPTVQVIQPTSRTIVRTVGQPSFIEAYERTSIFPKVTGYIEKWNVDIGDKVKKGETLATLYVPELVEDYGTKKATVLLDKERVDLAKVTVDVSQSDVEAAEAKLDEAKLILEKYQADVERWDSEVKRLSKETKVGVLAPQILLESKNQLKQSEAAKSAAGAAIANAKAELGAKQNVLRKSKVDVGVAKADLAVAESEEKRLKAWVGYLELVAPFDGIIEARNANTYDFVSPSAGDPTAMQRTPNLSPQHTAPIYVVDRTDIVRVFVDIPEHDANYVQVGTKASVIARAYKDRQISASVTRTSWALNVKSRTLRAEIDLPNTNSQILPGMYAYCKVVIERPNVLALPMEVLIQSGDRTFVWCYDNGHAVKTEVEVGVSDGEWIEVTNRRPAGSEEGHKQEVAWTPMDGSEQVILGDLEAISQGAPVDVAPSHDDSTTSTSHAAFVSDRKGQQ